MRGMGQGSGTASEGAVHSVVESGVVGEAARGEVGVLDVAPDGFDGAQFGAVGRQECETGTTTETGW